MAKPKLWSKEYIIQESIILHGEDKYGYDIVDGQFVKTSDRIRIDCECGHIFYQNMYDHLTRGRGCKKCAGKLQYDYDLLVEHGIQVHGNNYDYSLARDRPLNKNTTIMIKCNLCNHEFPQRITDHINDSNGCPKCAGKWRYDSHNYIERCRDVHGDKYEYLGIDQSKKITKKSIIYVRCNSCRCEFELTLDAHINNEQGCPAEFTYKGEEIIKNYLVKNNINYIFQYKLPTLNNRKFDFMLIDKKCIIEYDGRQHFDYVKWFHKSEDVFDEQKNIDVIKTVEAIKNRYTVIRIGYNVINIDAYLDYIFNSEKTLCVSSGELYKEHIQKVLDILPNITIEMGVKDTSI